MRKLVPAVIAAGLLAVLSASAAQAGQIGSATGAGPVNGRPAPAAPFALQPGQRFATPAGGSAVYRTDAGDEIKMDAGTTIRNEGVESGVEYHYLVQCKGHVGDSWPLLGTTGWAGVVAP